MLGRAESVAVDVSEYLDDLNATKNWKNPRRFERGSNLRTARMMFVFLLVAAFLLPGGPLAQNPETERYVSPWKTACAEPKRNGVGLGHGTLPACLARKCQFYALSSAKPIARHLAISKTRFS
jgi:hypothetical protein